MQKLTLDYILNFLESKSLKFTYINHISEMKPTKYNKIFKISLKAEYVK